MDVHDDSKYDFTWECPACFDTIEANDSDSLKWNVRQHIHLHETRAGLHAVEVAKSTCTRTYCGLSDPPTGKEITVYDAKLLAELKIKWY